MNPNAISRTAIRRIRVSTLATLALAIVASLVVAAPASAGDLTVTLHGIRAQTGLVKVAVVDSQAGWNGEAAPVQADGAPAQGEEATFSFKDLKPGQYAVMITHDENGNGKLDTNITGMPLEGYGFSNNPKVMRKAHFDEAVVELGDVPTTITLKLR